METQLIAQRTMVCRRPRKRKKGNFKKNRIIYGRLTKPVGPVYRT